MANCSLSRAVDRGEAKIRNCAPEVLAGACGTWHAMNASNAEACQRRIMQELIIRNTHVLVLGAWFRPVKVMWKPCQEALPPENEPAVYLTLPLAPPMRPPRPPVQPQEQAPSAAAAGSQASSSSTGQPQAPAAPPVPPQPAATFKSPPGSRSTATGSGQRQPPPDEPPSWPPPPTGQAHGPLGAPHATRVRRPGTERGLRHHGHNGAEKLPLAPLVRRSVPAFIVAAQRCLVLFLSVRF